MECDTAGWVSRYGDGPAACALCCARIPLGKTKIAARRQVQNFPAALLREVNSKKTTGSNHKKSNQLQTNYAILKSLNVMHKLPTGNDELKEQQASDISPAKFLSSANVAMLQVSQSK